MAIHSELRRPTTKSDEDRYLQNELYLFHESILPVFAETLSFYRKKKYGYRPILVLDFQVLHSYIFPYRQAPNRSISPALADFVLSSSIAEMVISPFTIVEMFRYLNRISAPQGGLDATMTQVFSALEKEPSAKDAVVLLNKLLDDQSGYRLSSFEIATLMEFVFKVAPTLANLFIAFVRMMNLFRQTHIVSFTNFVDENIAIEYEELYEVLRYPLVTKRGNRKSGGVDAENLAFLTTLNQKSQKGELEGKPFFQYLTGTNHREAAAELLNQTNLSSVYEDISLPGHVRRNLKDHPEAVMPIGMAAVITAVSNENPDWGYDDAYYSYCSSADLEVNILKVDQFSEKEGNIDSTRLQRIRNTKKVLANSPQFGWYRHLIRHFYTVSATIEMPVSYSDSSDNADRDQVLNVVMTEQGRERISISFEGSFHGTDGETTETDEARSGMSDEMLAKFNLLSEPYDHDLNGDRLRGFRLRFWRSSSVGALFDFSLSDRDPISHTNWETATNFAGLTRELSEIASSLEAVDFRVIGIYPLETSEIFESGSYPKVWESRESRTVAYDFTDAVEERKLNEQMQLEATSPISQDSDQPSEYLKPVEVVLETGIGDARFRTNYLPGDGKNRVEVKIASQEGLHQLLLPLLKTTWILSCNLIALRDIEKRLDNENLPSVDAFTE